MLIKRVIGNQIFQRICSNQAVNNIDNIPQNYTDQAHVCLDSHYGCDIQMKDLSTYSYRPLVALL